MKYVIKGEKDSIYSQERYLAKVRFENSQFPYKDWTLDANQAMVFDSEESAKYIIKLLGINTPETMTVEKLENDEYLPFKRSDVMKIELKKADLYFKSNSGYFPARVICTDRKGITSKTGKLLKIVALVTHPTEGEILMEATENGEVWSKQQGMHQALFIKFKK